MWISKTFLDVISIQNPSPKQHKLRVDCQYSVQHVQVYLAVILTPLYNVE